MPCMMNRRTNPKQLQNSFNRYKYRNRIGWQRSQIVSVGVEHSLNCDSSGRTSDEISSPQEEFVGIQNRPHQIL